MASDQTAPQPSPATPVSLSALCLAAVTLLTLVDSIAGWRPAAFAAAPILIAYFLREWHKLIINARVLFGLCAVLTAVVLPRADALAILGSAASRMIYLPGFIAMLGLLRAAASVSDVIASAGRHLVAQPPSRRYLALAFGGHMFGILFNIGGLALLVDMTKRANTLAAASGDPRIVDWRERRMTSAIVRGFAAVVFWSPLGVAMNLILASIPDIGWADVAPIGIAVTIAFIGLGWLFDRIQRPPALRPAPRETEPGGARAVAIVVAHVAAITSITGAAELVLLLPFQTTLLVVVPAYAFLWALATSLKRQEARPLAATLGVLRDRGVARFPDFANEVSVFATSGFLGVVLVALVPRATLQALFAALALPPGVIAASLTLAIAALGMIGINPLITAAILASVLSAVDIPGLSKVMLALALVTGWGVTVVAAPMNSSLVMTASILGRTSWEVGIRWNGAFALAVLVVAAVAFVLLV